MKSRHAALALMAALVFLVPNLAGAQARAGGPGGNALTGTIVSIKGLSFVITLDDGSQKTVVLKDGALVLDREVATTADIKVGDAVGVASKTENGAMVATSINIFAPQMWTNMKTAQFTMTNGETMTNAMTAQVEQNSQGRVLTLKLEMGTATITVPDGIQIHRLVAVKPAQLTPGMKVTFRVTAGADGSLTASGASFDQQTSKG